MYGLPEDFDARVFVGARLDYITFYQYQVLFEFDRGAERIGVAIESSFSFTPPGGRIHVPVEATDAMRHVGRVVVSAAAETDGTIILDLDDGTVIRFFEDGLECESYSLYLPDGRRIVV